MSAASLFVHNHLNVTTAGTPQQLPQASIQSVIVQAKPGNTGAIAIGGSNTVRAASGASQRGVNLAAGATLTVKVDDLSDIWVDAATSGEGVHYAYTAS